MTSVETILAGWGLLAVLMAALWVVQWRRRNAGIVDVAWAFGTGVLAVWFAAAADGDPVRRALVATMAGVWGLRLGWHLARRVARETEDGRYLHLRDALGARVQPVMFLFFQLQAIWGVMFALPMWAAVQSPTPGLAWHDVLGLLVWLVAMGGEMIADSQLDRFRRDPANRGKVCDQGLWRYSRHPNYFFEWVHWWAYVLIGIGSSWWWVTIVGVVVMYVFLTRITGIPYTEQQALRSRGDAYRRYQRTTNAFVPFRPSRLEEEHQT